MIHAVKAYYITTELKDCGIETMLFGSETERDDKAHAILREAYYDVFDENVDGTYPQDYDDLSTCHNLLANSRWGEDNGMCWGDETIQVEIPDPITPPAN